MAKISGRRFITAVGVFLLALVGVVAVAGLYFLQQNTFSQQDWDELMLTGVYHDGITIDGISVGGMTLEQAREAVEKKMKTRVEAIRLALIYDVHTYELTRNDFIISDNTNEVTEEALRAAREGSRVKVQKEIDDIAENGKAYLTDYTVNTAPVKTRLGAIAVELYKPAQDASIRINKDDRNNRFTYTDDVSGVEVDLNALYAAVEKQIRLRQYGTVAIPVKEIPASVTTETLQAGTAQLATAATSFGRSPYNRDSRVANIKKAVGIINGYVLKPGAEFSANTVLGPRTYARGWQPAPAIVRGGSEDQAGGGVCQVSTTLYNAVLKADLEIVSRKGHSIKLSYVDGGLDATINTGTIDFVFRNNTDADAYIFCWVDGSEQKVHFEIYRAVFPDAYDEIRLMSEKVETLYPAGEMLVTLDTTKPAGYREKVQSRRNGSIYKSYKHFYKNGQEVGTPQLIVKTTYKAYAGEIIVGPKIAQKPAPTETPMPAATPEPTEETKTAAEQ